MDCRVRLAGIAREVEPGAADGGMKDGLEGLSLHLIGKDNGPKRRTLQDPVLIEDRCAKLGADPLDHPGIRCRQLAGASVRVEHAELRQQLAETTRKESLAAGDAARNSEYWHGKTNPSSASSRQDYFWKRGASGEGWTGTEGSGSASTASSC